MQMFEAFTGMRIDDEMLSWAATACTEYRQSNKLFALGSTGRYSYYDAGCKLGVRIDIVPR